MRYIYTVECSFIIVNLVKVSFFFYTILEDKIDLCSRICSSFFQTDNPARLAKSLGVKHKYTDVQVRILRKKLENEFEKRNIEIR